MIISIITRSNICCVPEYVRPDHILVQKPYHNTHGLENTANVLNLEMEFDDSFSRSGDDIFSLWSSSSQSQHIFAYPDFIREKPERAPLEPFLIPGHDQEDIKHGDYTAHLLVLNQAREYAVAVEDTTQLLKIGTQQLLDAATRWRGSNSGQNEKNEKAYYPSLLTEELTQVGRHTLSISESIKKLQHENAILFWTGGQREDVLKLLVELSKDMVKLRRKLGRIKGNFGDRVRNVRRAVMKFGFEASCSETTVPPEIYYEWVREDSQNCQASYDSVPNTCKKSKGKFVKIKKVVKNILSCRQQPADNVSASSLESVSDIDIPSKICSSPTKMYQIRKDVKILHKDDRDHETDSVYEGEMENLRLRSSPYENRKVNSFTDGYIAPMPSQKCLEIIASNVLPPNVSSINFIYDNRHPTLIVKEPLKNDALSDKETCKNFYNTKNQIMNQNYTSIENKKKLSTQDIVQANLHTTKTVNANELVALPENEYLNEKQSVAAMHANGSDQNSFENNSTVLDINTNDMIENLTTTPNEKKVNSAPVYSPIRKILSESMRKNLNLIKDTKEMIHCRVSEVIENVRDTERNWLSPQQKVKSKKYTELYQLVDFIVKTVKHVDDPIFASQLYQEDRDEIVSELYPVFRELTTCYVALCELFDLVLVDTLYLKELLAGFPKGDLLIRDWVYDPYQDETIDELDQSMGFTVDVDELFA